jgi:hypothetical protein
MSRRNKSRTKAPKRQPLFSVNAGYQPDSVTRQYLPKIRYPAREIFETSFPLEPPFQGWRGELTWKYAMHRGVIVDWALMLDVFDTTAPVDLANDGPRKRRHVERVDCCDSQIHRHIFTINSDPADEDGERRVLRPLTAGDEAIVDSECDHYFAMINMDWAERVRRWRDG